MNQKKYNITISLGDSKHTYTYDMKNVTQISGNLISGNPAYQAYTITPYGITPKTMLDAYDRLDAEFDKLEDQTSIAKQMLNKLGIKCD